MISNVFELDHNNLVRKEQCSTSVEKKFYSSIGVAVNSVNGEGINDVRGLIKEGVEPFIGYLLEVEDMERLCKVMDVVIVTLLLCRCDDADLFLKEMVVYQIVRRREEEREKAVLEFIRFVGNGRE